MTKARDVANVPTNFPVGAWTAYTPTWSGISSTGATSTGRYVQLGKTVHFFARYVVGSSGISVSGGITPSLPITKNSNSFVISNGWIDDTGTTYFLPIMREGTAFANTTTGAANFSNIVPMVWAVNDGITIGGTYEAA